MHKLWFSFFNEAEYKGNEPGFYNKEAFPFADTLEHNYKLIKDELKDYLKGHQLQSYFNEALVEKKDSWKVISLRFWDIDFPENQRHFQKTMTLINAIPHLTSASFTLLEPGSKIKPHCGDTNAMYRFHLGLDIPGVLPECGFKSKGDWRNWEEGKLLIFNDANLHQAINLTDRPRLIFIFDTVRPEYVKRKNYISAVVISSMYLSLKMATDKHYKNRSKKMIRLMCKLMAGYMLFFPKYKEKIFSRVN